MHAIINIMLSAMPASAFSAIALTSRLSLFGHRPHTPKGGLEHTSRGLNPTSPGPGDQLYQSVRPLDLNQYIM